MAVLGLPPVFLTGVNAADVTVSPSVEGQGVVYLGPQSDELRGLAASATEPEGKVWQRANTLFEGMNKRTSTEFGNVVLAGWQNPDMSESNRKGTVDSIGEAFANTVAVQDPKSKPGAVPPPCDEECRKSLRDAVAQGQSLKSAGKIQFDGQNQPLVLKSPAVIGAFVYDKAKAIGVFYSEQLALIARYAGDTIAGATTAHELGHADDYANGKLQPDQVTEGEKRAFKRQYGYLVKLDPKGQMLAKLRYYLVGNPRVPKIAQDYLEHLAMVRLYGEAGDYDGLVKKLGYEDPSHHHGDGHDHGD